MAKLRAIGIHSRLISEYNANIKKSAAGKIREFTKSRKSTVMTEKEFRKAILTIYPEARPRFLRELYQFLREAGLSLSMS